MCGIIGYVGEQNARPILLNGLKKLEYRGYDSAGLVILNNNSFFLKKIVGRINKLEEEINKYNIFGTLGIAHTRWATHGKVTEANTHPHTDCQNNIFVVHNGIIENYQDLKENLQNKGHKFISETDTEIISHLIEEFYTNNLREAVIKALKLIRGAYAMLAIHKETPDRLIAAKLSSPLVVGLKEEGILVASDQLALSEHTSRIVFLDDYELVEATKQGYQIVDFNNQSVNINKKIYTINWSKDKISKAGYSHFMLKEIMEQGEAVTNSMRGRIDIKNNKVILGGLDQYKNRLKQTNRIVIVACGTAYFAGMAARYLFKKYLPMPIEVELASEFRYMDSYFDKDTLLIAISQSGETADTLKAVQLTKENGTFTLGIINVVGSTIAREVDAGIYNHIGPEIAVASTKAFISQLTILVMLAVYLGQLYNLSLEQARFALKELLKIPDFINNVVKTSKHIKTIASKYAKINNCAFIGRKFNYPIALEGALKLKEISYIHAEGWPSGELKHGSIALIEENFPTVAIVPQDSVYEKNISNIEEIKSRNGKIVAIASAGDKKILKLADDIIFIPKTFEELTPLLSVIPLQLFAYHMAVLRGCDVDKPRNLAKSVTVE